MMATARRKKIAFVTSSLVPQSNRKSSFDFFAILTSEVLHNLQQDYDVIVRVPEPEEVGEIGRSQSALLAQLLSGGRSFHGFVVSPIDVESIASVVSRAYKQPSPVRIITIDQSLESSRLFRPKAAPSCVIPDNRQGGALAAESLWHYYQTFRDNQRLPHPKFIVVQGTGASPVRSAGFTSGIKRLSKHRARVSVSPQLSFSRQSAFEWVRGELENSPEAWRDVVGIFACNDELALGVCDALDWHLRSSGRGQSQIITAAVVGFDGIRDVTGRIEQKNELWLVNTVQIPIDAMAKQLKDVLRRLAHGSRERISDKLKCTLFKKDLESQEAFSVLFERRIRWAEAFGERLRPDVVVVPVKSEEGKAVLKRLKSPKQYDGIHRTYTIGKVKRDDGRDLSIAVIRPLEQGIANAQDTTRDAIEDLDPKLIALVGIGGAKPAREFGLGDVVVCTRLHDLTMGAYIQDPRTKLSTKQFTNIGGPMEKVVLDLIGELDGLEKKLGGWNSRLSVGLKQPKISVDKARLYGSAKEKERTMKILRERFGSRMRKKPIFYAGPIASDSNLVKDMSVIQRWTDVAREFVAVDMELPGVYVAANRRDKHYPILAVRGISDVVGFERDHPWTLYACETAASFFIKLLRVHPGLNPKGRFLAGH